VQHLDRLAGLTILDVGSLGGLTDLMDLSRLRELRLCLGSGSIAPAVLERLLRLPTLGRLRVLQLSCRPGGDGVVRAVVESPHLTRLRELDLRFLLSSDDVRLLAGWPGLARLDRLELHTPFQRAPGEEAMTELAQSPHLSPLTRLRITGIFIPNHLRQILRDRLGWRAGF
jgi:hypothetical protein